MTRESVAKGIASDLRRSGVPVTRAGWQGSRMCMLLSTGALMVLPTKPTSTPIELEQTREAALALYREEWARLQKVMQDRLTGTCSRCDRAVESTGLVYLLDRSIVCPSCYRTKEGS